MNRGLKWLIMSKVGFLIFLSPWIFLLAEPFHGVEKLTGWWILLPMCLGLALWGFSWGIIWEMDGNG